ncbi:MAG: Rne/Rng family ribonuclease [Bacteriovoracaceae bacterium]|nr:Rne/Rng family ribonuclease [Bacteriovoracaceae bacterium]
MKRILINAVQAEELRVAMVDGNYLYDLDIEIPSKEQVVANIYKGRVHNIKKSLEAAFVDYGFKKHGLLSLRDLSRTIPKVEIKEGMEVIVQVEKEERGSKGANLSAQISLAGRYLVLMPNKTNAGGISRRIYGEDRNKLKLVMRDLVVPESMSVIVRTAGIGKAKEDLQWDLDYLIKLWDLIQEGASRSTTPSLIYKESNVIIRALRDCLKTDTDEVLIDDPEVYKEAHQFISSVMPSFLNKVKLYKNKLHIFNKFQIETQIETAFSRTVTLKSGGSIILDHTEALTSIDVNSGRTRGGKNIEETALKTNMEAASEVARQLRIRDMGGLVVVDFIDMVKHENQRKLENYMKEVLKLDRARIQMAKISMFGLLEMSRQRIRPSLIESAHNVCPRCNGQGSIRDIESLALSILRLVEEEALLEDTLQVHARVPIEIAAFLLNEKRADLLEVEKNLNIKVFVVPNPHMHTPEFKVERIKAKSKSGGSKVQESYVLIPKSSDLSAKYMSTPSTVNTTASPAVKSLKRDKQKNLLRKVWDAFMGRV